MSRTAVAYVVIRTSAASISAASCGRGRSRRAVVDDDAQPRGEARRLGRPVADDRRRRDHERRSGRRGTGEVGEHRRGLAEAHVEGEAAAEVGALEEPDPRQGLGLVAAQLAGEPLRSGDRRRRGLRGARQDVGRPAVAADVDAELGAVESEAVAQDLGPRELTVLGALGEGGGRLLEVEPVDLDPAVARPDEGASLLGELGDRRRP